MNYAVMADDARWNLAYPCNHTCCNWLMHVDLPYPDGSTTTT